VSIMRKGGARQAGECDIIFFQETG
jgi:hypothetical protein